MADRKITDFLTLATLKTNTIFTVVDPDEGAPVDENKKITVSSMFSTFEPTFSKNTAFNKNFAGTGAATTVSKSDHDHSGVYEPVFNKNTAFNKDFGTGAGQVSEGDHDHSGVYEPVFSKNTAFNKNFGGSGAATTVAKSDHTHNLESLTDVQQSALTASDVFYYNGSLWTNLPVAQAKNTYSYWNNGGSGSNIAYSAGTVEVGNTLILSSVIADTGFGTSALLSLDTAGNVDKIAASGGGTVNFLRADGTWAAPPGGGGSPGGAANEIQKNDGAGGFAGTGSFSSSGGDLVLGTGLAGSGRTIQATGSATPVDLILTPTGVASNLYLSHGTTSGLVYIGATGATGTERRLSVAGSQSNINLIISAKGTGKVYWSDGTNNQEMGIANGGSSTQNGATYTVDCGNQQQYKETITTDNTPSTWTISNLDDEATLFILNTETPPDTKVITLSATGIVFINMSTKVAITAAASTLAITIPSGTNETHEINLADSGFTDSGDRVIHVIQI